MTGNAPLGRVAYEGYRDAAGRKSLISGADLPHWLDLAPEIQNAWRVAAEAVVHAEAMTARKGGDPC